jgi:hypothetical protein
MQAMDLLSLSTSTFLSLSLPLSTTVYFSLFDLWMNRAAVAANNKTPALILSSPPFPLHAHGSGLGGSYFSRVFFESVCRLPACLAVMSLISPRYLVS